MALRELALILIVATLCVTALFKPRFGLYGYIWFALVQPDVAAWVERKYPFSIALAIATLVGSLRYVPELPRLFRIPAVAGLLLLQIPIGLSILYCEGQFLAPDRYDTFMRIMVMALMTPLLIRTRKELKELLLLYVICQGMFGSRFGMFGLVNGGVLLRVSNADLLDNNEIGVSIAMMIAICWYYRSAIASRLGKLAVLAIILTSAPAVVMTDSRGASLALGVVFLLLLLWGRRRLGMLLVLALAAGPAIYLIKDAYFSRMSTIGGKEYGENSIGRVDFWKASLVAMQDHPLLGFGFGQRNYAVQQPKYLGQENISAIHNTYLQMQLDSGAFASLIYLSLLFGTIVWLGKSAKRARPGDKEIRAASRGFQVALISFAIDGCFFSFQRFELAYYLVMSAAAVYNIQATEDYEPEPDGSQDHTFSEAHAVAAGR